ncbi:YciI family protein [Gammaproteobacteria bacterium]|nr:YciI family protein [Gammaproteobacteria bacterium]
MFIVSISYSASLAIIDEFIDEHCDFLDRQYALGHFQLSGRKEPRTGGIILATVDSRDLLDQILSLDPFRRENLADYDVTEFSPSMSSESLAFLVKT